jgi:hypothetical protein
MLCVCTAFEYASGRTIHSLVSSKISDIGGTGRSATLQAARQCTLEDVIFSDTLNLPGCLEKCVTFMGRPSAQRHFLFEILFIIDHVN